MARIYLSSTFQDLKEHREAVSLSLRRLGHEDVAMEYYVASEEKPLDQCLRDVANCDLYIGIFAWRYGYIPEGYDKSITELEYRQAVSSGKPCLIFLLDEDAPWKKSFMEVAAMPQIEELRAEFTKAYQVDFFSTTQELSALVSQAVSNWEKRNSTKTSDQYVLLQQRYKQQVFNRYRELYPPVFSGAPHRVPIDQLYIDAVLVDSKENNTLSLNDFMKTTSKTVVLGNPGSGKSTLASKLLYELSSPTAPLLQGKSVLPILVTLREYALDKSNSKPSIIHFIAIKAGSDYQINVTEDFFEHLLETAQALIIFDGLDEILDTALRQEIVKDIEAFCNLYQNTPILVTSRETGYEQAPLNKDEFQIFNLLPFTNRQVEQYIEKWFSYLGSKDPQSIGWSSTAFLNELSSVSTEITSNPLLLSLLCTIYQNEGDIPRNKADIYEKCAQLLIERRDKERGIVPELAAKSSIFSVVAYLAYRIYGETALESGVSKKKLIAETANYLQHKLYENFDEAEYAANQLIEFLINRAWVFTDVGTNANSESLYQFAHRTFLEYFAAKYLVRIHRTPDDLLDDLLPNLAKDERIAVSLLAIQQMARDAEGADNVILERIFVEAKESKNVKLLLFSMNCLEFIIPRQSMTKSMIQLCVDLSLEFAVEYIKSEAISLEELYEVHADYEQDHFFTRVIYLITQCLPENLATISLALEEGLTDSILTKDELYAILASEASLNLGQSLHLFYFNKDHNVLSKWEDFYDEIKKKIVAACEKQITEVLAPKAVLVAIDTFFEGKISMQELVSWHGTQSLFSQYYYIIYSNISSGEIALNWLSHLFKEDLEDVGAQKRRIERLRQLGQVLIDLPTPWAGIPEDGMWSFGPNVQKNWHRFSLDRDALFGAFLALAFNYERWFGPQMHGSSSEKLEELIPNCFLQMFITRFKSEKINSEELLSELAALDFSPKQRQFALNWTTDKIDLVIQWR
jgi:GTPase SAR1 family protein